MGGGDQLTILHVLHKYADRFSHTVTGSDIKEMIIAKVVP